MVLEGRMYRWMEGGDDVGHAATMRAGWAGDLQLPINARHHYFVQTHRSANSRFHFPLQCFLPFFTFDIIPTPIIRSDTAGSVHTICRIMFRGRSATSIWQLLHVGIACCTIEQLDGLYIFQYFIYRILSNLLRYIICVLVGQNAVGAIRWFKGPKEHGQTGSLTGHETERAVRDKGSSKRPWLVLWSICFDLHSYKSLLVVQFGIELQNNTSLLGLRARKPKFPRENFVTLNAAASGPRLSVCGADQG